MVRELRHETKVRMVFGCAYQARLNIRTLFKTSVVHPEIPKSCRRALRPHVVNRLAQIARVDHG